MGHGKLIVQDIGHHFAALVFIQKHQGAFKHVEEEERRDRQIARSMGNEVGAYGYAHRHHAHQDERDTVKKVERAHYRAFRRYL